MSFRDCKVQNAKRNLKNDEFWIICDFSENYAFAIQNAITGFHWNNNQATIFPIVFYYKDIDHQNTSNTHQIKHQTLIIISDSPKHNAVAVHVFLEALNEYLSQNYPQIHKCINFTDGSPQQFKNVKHFLNYLLS